MAIQTVTFHKRSTGMTGQVLASKEIEGKLARVEALYQEVYGVKMGRYTFYRTLAATCNTWRRMQPVSCLTGCTRLWAKRCAARTAGR